MRTEVQAKPLRIGKVSIPCCICCAVLLLNAAAFLMGGRVQAQQQEKPTGTEPTPDPLYLQSSQPSTNMKSWICQKRMG